MVLMLVQGLKLGGIYNVCGNSTVVRRSCVLLGGKVEETRGYIVIRSLLLLLQCNGSGVYRSLGQNSLRFYRLCEHVWIFQVRMRNIDILLSM